MAVMRRALNTAKQEEIIIVVRVARTFCGAVSRNLLQTISQRTDTIVDIVAITTAANTSRNTPDIQTVPWPAMAHQYIELVVSLSSLSGQEI